LATQTLPDHRSALLGMLRRWDRRQRVQQTLAWLPRAALPGLGAGVALALISRLRPLLLPEQIAVLTLALVALGMALALGIIWLRPRTALQSARHFDIVFGLNERVSTALELLDGEISTSSALAAAQLEDARHAARRVRARERLPLQAGRADVLALLALGMALLLLLALPNLYSEALAVESAQSAAEQAAAENAADTVRELTEQTASDPRLEDAERAALLQVLEDSARALNEPEVTPEQAFAAMSEVQAAFQQASEALERRLSENAAALQAASEALRAAAPTDESADLSNVERMLNQIEAMRELAERMGVEPQPEAADRLTSAAEAMRADGGQTMQDAANAMQGAAEAMQSGDSAGAQQALERAQEAIEQAGAESSQQQQAQQSLERGAQQAQQAGSQINEAQQPPGEQDSQAPQNQPGSQPQSGEGEPQPQQGAAPQGQQGDVPSSQGQEGNAEQGADGANQGQSQEGQGQQSENAQGDNPGALSGAALRSEGAGAGDEPSGEAQASPGSGQPIQANNNPDGAGERAFTPVYAPEQIGGPQGDEQMILEPDIENAPIVEGEFSSNPGGDARVPYSRVFRDFLSAAVRNLDTGYVPLGLRDVVRSYFTSIEPGTGE
jgi:hypothetical protein